MRHNKTELMKPVFVMLEYAFAISFMNLELSFILIRKTVHVNARYKGENIYELDFPLFCVCYSVL